MMQLGVTERALEMTATYSRERVQFDRPIGSFQAVHQRAADAYIDVEAIRLSALEAAWRLSENRPAEEHVAVAKVLGSRGRAVRGFRVPAPARRHRNRHGLPAASPLHLGDPDRARARLGQGSQLDQLGRSIAADGLPQT